MLESGEYFGESGVLTYFNGGSKASSTAPPMTEQFCFVARTSVEMLVLRRKHFNIIEIPVNERGLFFLSGWWYSSVLDGKKRYEPLVPSTLRCLWLTN